MKKLCLVIPSLQPGGMERVMMELAGFFTSKNDLEVHIVLFGADRSIFYELPPNLLVHRPGFKFNNSQRFYYTLKTLRYLRKEIIKINPDSILSFGELWNSFLLLSLFGSNYPVFISDRCSPSKRFSLFHRILKRWLYPRAKGIIAQTEKAKELYKTRFRNFNIKVIGNPIRKICTKDIEVKKENIVLTVGRLIKTKHHDKLIELFANISINDWKLIIIGDNALKQDNFRRLADLISSLKVTGKVFLMGSQQDVDEFYLKSRIFAFTSSSEGFPNVIGEAMSAGLPVVSFDCIAGPSDLIIDSQTGFLITLFDWGKFEEKLLQLMQNEPLRRKMGEEAKEAIKRHSVSEIGERYLSFITS